MHKINLITAPDKINSRSFKFLLLYPSADVTEQLQNQIAEWDNPIDIYMYDKEYELDWLMDVFNMADCVIWDIDNTDDQAIRDLGSFLVSFPKTYWLTKGDFIVYNKLSLNKVYNLDFIQKYITGGNIEI